MKAKKLALVSSAFALLGAFALGVASATPKAKVSAAGETTSETVATDYNAFKLRGGTISGSIAVNATKDAFTYTGGWDSNFAVTDQFDTRAGNYSLKAHVYDEDWAISTDMLAGFCIYYNDSNYLKLYLKWNSEESTACFTEGVMHNRVNGSESGSYQKALLPSGAFENGTTFTDLWSDGINWTVNGVGTNLRTSSTTLVSKGFDMTLHVERSTYSGRAVDIVQLQVDSYASDGTTPLTAYSPKYAIDAFTNPLGNGASSLIDRKPQIGFYQNGMTDVTYSDIVFTNKNTEKVDAKFTRVGTQPTTATVNADANTLTYNNSNYGTGFMMGDFATTSTGSVDVQATVSGTNGNINDTSIGFSYYFDDKNYAIIFVKWDGGSDGTIDGLHAIFTVDGKNNAAAWARNPWETSYTKIGDGGFIDNWSNFGGWITDSPEPMGTYNNFNNMRSESAITIASGFTFGLQRTRVTYASRLVDAFQFRISAQGTDGVSHNWYSATICVDAYTCPNGGDASEFVDVAPQIGFYAFNVGEITLSDIKCNGKKANVSYSNKEQGRIDARKFVADYLHFSDVSKDNGEEGTACKGENGYYATAKTGWNALSNDARSVLATEDEFADARARLLAWASANGDKLDGSNALVASSNSILNGGSSNGSDVAIAAVSVSVLAAALCAAFLFIKKKKSSEK